MDVLSVLEMVISVMSDQNMTTPIAAASTSVTMAIVALFMGMLFRSTIILRSLRQSVKSFSKETQTSPTWCVM